MTAAWVAFEIEDLLYDRARSGRPVVEFLRAPSLSAKVSRLAAGTVDRQTSQTEDEMVYVLRGRAVFRAAGEDRPVRSGTVLYVKAGVERCFHSIAEDLAVLVVVTPASVEAEASV